MIERIRSLSPRFLAYRKIWLQQMLFWVGAILIALVAIAFAKISAWGDHLFSSSIQGLPFLALLITPAGFALVVWLTRSYFAGTEGSGIPQAIAALDAPEIADRASILSLRLAFGKVLLTTMGLCVGASVGREGPSVQVGSAIMHSLGKWLKLPSPQIRRALILAGGAAGIAAAFNTPLAGILFAIEELSRSFEEQTSGTVLTTVIVSGIVSIAVVGDYNYFGTTNVSLALAQAWKPILLCGLVGGLLGGGFSKLLLLFSKGIPGRAGAWIEEHPVAFAAACGFSLAVIGLLCDQTTFGTGYGEAKDLLEGTREMPSGFGLMKLVATAVSYVSGLPGGLFAPSLAVGAGFGSNLAGWMPDLPSAAIILLGMVGYFTGVVQVPITATVIVMEMTDDQSLTLPLMATAFIAYAVSRFICPTPLYRTLALDFLTRKKQRFIQDDLANQPAPPPEEVPLQPEETPPENTSPENKVNTPE